MTRSSGAMLSVLFAITSTAPVTAADVAKIERSISKEPTYKTKTPKYSLLVFGADASYRVWLVLDGSTLYVDRNGNGDLTEAGESTTPAAENTEPVGFKPVTLTGPDGKASENLRFTLYGWADYKAGKKSPSVVFAISVSWNGRRYGSWGDETGPCVWGASPQDAPILHVGGPLQMGFEVGAASALAWKGPGECVLSVGVGTKGLGAGSFVHLKYANDAIPKDVYPTALLEFPNKAAGSPPIRIRQELKDRCCTSRLRDSVRVDGVAEEGEVTITLNFDSWKEGQIAPATFKFPVRPKAKEGKP